MILDPPGGPSVITRILKSREPFPGAESQRDGVMRRNQPAFAG